MANGMWCSASSRTTSPISLGGTSGIWIFLMMSSRPQIEIAASEPFTPALATASFTASATMPGSLMAPSVIVSFGNGTMPKAVKVREPPLSRIWMTFTALEPMSSPKLSRCFPNILFNKFFPLAELVV